MKKYSKDEIARCFLKLANDAQNASFENDALVMDLLDRFITKHDVTNKEKLEFENLIDNMKKMSNLPCLNTMLPGEEAAQIYDQTTLHISPPLPTPPNPAISYKISEQKKIEKKINNIIIYGIRSIHLADLSDFARVDHILSLAGLSRNTVQSQCRISTINPLDIIRITFKTNESKQRLIAARSYIIRRPEFKSGIYIKNDYTYSQRLNRSHMLHIRNLLNNNLPFVDSLNRRYGLQYNNKKYFYVLGETEIRIHVIN